jgi:hypothetical protein
VGVKIKIFLKRGRGRDPYLKIFQLKNSGL